MDDTPGATGKVAIDNGAGVSVEVFQPGDDPAASTCLLMCPEPLGLPSSGRDEFIIGMAKQLLSILALSGVNQFFNPRYRVSALDPSQEFLLQARLAQQAWMRTVRASFGNVVTRKWLKESAKAHPLMPQLVYTGILLVHGKHRFPGQWPQTVRMQAKCDLTGQRFGKLTVIESLANARCRCRCECGNMTIVYRKHLNSGATTSCGCRKRALTERHQKNRDNRGWRRCGLIINPM